MPYVDSRQRTSWANTVLIIVIVLVTGASALTLGIEIRRRNEREKSRLIREAYEQEIQRTRLIVPIKRAETSQD